MPVTATETYSYQLIRSRFDQAVSECLGKWAPNLLSILEALYLDDNSRDFLELSLALEHFLLLQINKFCAFVFCNELRCHNANTRHVRNVLKNRSWTSWSWCHCFTLTSKSEMRASRRFTPRRCGPFSIDPQGHSLEQRVRLHSPRRGIPHREGNNSFTNISPSLNIPKESTGRRVVADLPDWLPF